MAAVAARRTSGEALTDSYGEGVTPTSRRGGPDAPSGGARGRRGLGGRALEAVRLRRESPTSDAACDGEVSSYRAVLLNHETEAADSRGERVENFKGVEMRAMGQRGR